MSWRATSERYTIPAVLDRQAAERPDQVYLHIGDEAITYAAMRDRSIAMANGLLSLGIEAGDTVALFGATSPEWLYGWFATTRIGARMAAINPYYRGEYLLNPLRTSGAKVAVTDAAMVERIMEVAAELPELKTLVVRPGSEAASADTGSLEQRSTTELLEHACDNVAQAEPLSWNDISTLFFTSGTTGPSKAVMTTQHYLFSAARTLAVDCWKLQPGETVWSPLPLFHLSTVGTVLGPMLTGSTSVIETAFHPGQTWQRVRQFNAVGMVAAGAIVNMLWNLPEDPADREVPLRFISAAPIAPEIYHGIKERYGVDIVSVYGMTEAFPLSIKRVDDPDVPGASGFANPDFEFRIFDEADNEVPVGEVGEIVCRPNAPHVMSEGYFQRHDATVRQLGNLWFHTGDLGRVDEQGCLYFVDRKKDAMRRRGENVSSFELEQIILRHPAVAEGAAIAVPSDLGEDDIMLCLVLKPESQWDPMEFMEYCNNRMPYFAVPRYLRIMDSLPKNMMGRVTKDDLRREGVTAETWDREAAGFEVKR